MKMLFRIRILLLFVCFSWMVNIQVSATHIVGGEIYYEHLGGNDYLITLKVYRDCGPDNVNQTGFDQEAHVGVYSGTTLNQVFDLSLFTATVNVVPIVLDNPCFTPPLDLCVEEAIYHGTISLSPNVIGYDIVYQRCCRNNSIINIQDAADSGMSVFSHIPGTSEATGYNSAPVFNNFPPVALCLGAEFLFDHSAFDADGDELIYEFYAPFLGGGPDNLAPSTSPNSPTPNPPFPPAYSSVAWLPDYSDSYQVQASPGFTIDPATGYITGTATQIGRYAVGVAVHEYRDGVLINTTYRDIQYNVTVCDPTIVAAMSVDEQLYCEGLTFNFINESVNGSSFYWDFGDPNSEMDISTETSPSYTYSEPGDYEVMLIANPEWFCADTAFAEYSAVMALNAQIEISDYECIEGENVYSFGTTGENPPTATYQWDFGNNATPQFSTEINPGNVVFNGVGVQDISVLVSDFECENTQETSIEIPSPPIPVIGAQDEFCNGFTVNFVNNSEGAETYSWDFGDPTNSNDNSSLFEPTYTYSDTGFYEVTLEVSIPLTCPVSTTEEFMILPLMEAVFEPPGGACLSDNTFDLDFSGSATNTTTFYWNFGGAQPATSTLMNPVPISYTTAGAFPVSLTISNEYCEKEYTDTAYVYTDPTIDFSIGGGMGCQPLEVTFEDHSFSENTLYYLWDFGDGGQSVSSNPTYIYENAGVYDVTLTAYTLSGCIASLTQTNSGAVICQPKPVSNFYISPAEVNILEPDFVVADLSEGGVSVNYTYDGTIISNEFEFSYSIPKPGIHFITQEVVSEFGCVAESTFGVVVSGHLLYVPTAFSPNDDGINDYFQIRSLGIVEFNMKIYNRWGIVVHETNDINSIWMGEKDGGEYYYGQNENYTYHITYLGQFESEKKELIGTITILR